MDPEKRTQRVVFKIAPETFDKLKDAAFEEMIPFEMYLAIALETVIDLRETATRFQAELEEND